MLKKIKEMTGMKKVVLETLGVMVLVSAVYFVAYLIGGKVEVALTAALAAALVVAVTFAAFAAFAAAGVAAFAFAFPLTATVFAFATRTTVAFVFAIAFVFAVAFVIADYYRVKYRKVLMIYLIEIQMLVLAFILPYIALGVLVGAIVALGVMLLREKKSAVAPESRTAE